MKIEVFVAGRGVKAARNKKRREAALAARTAAAEAERAAERAAALAAAREGTVVVRFLMLCGGSPASPSCWTRDQNLMRVRADDLRAVRTSAGWGAATHCVGKATCRLATPEEVAAFEAREEAAWRVSVAKMWRGVPVLPAPKYPQ